MKLFLDPESPVPLYHQIAEAVRYEVATGKLTPGEVLPSVREAASRWSVNMHTVRRSYQVLSDEGLVVIDGARGTRVAGMPGQRSSKARVLPVQRFLGRILQEARERHGLGPGELVHLLANWSPSPAAEARTVHVVECSEAQCAAHVAEIEGQWDVMARPWCLIAEGEPPPGSVVATYFHYNEIRRRWPNRLHDIRFVAIHPDPEIAARLPAPHRGKRMSVVLCEFELSQAQNTAADLSVILPPENYSLQPRVVEQANELLKSPGSRMPVLFTPRVWAALTPEERALPRAIPVTYVIKHEELEALGADFGWGRRLEETARPRRGRSTA